MKFYYLFFLSIIFVASACTEQKEALSDTEASDEVLSPILLDKTILSGIGLDTFPSAAEPDKGFYRKELYEGEDLTLYVVSLNSWLSHFKDFWFDEFIYIFHGEARVKPDGGKDYQFMTGDYFFAPKGYTGEWEIQAGTNNHYELSLIATERADSSLKNKSLEPLLLDKSKIAGTQIVFDENGRYEEILAQGIELTVKIEGEEPMTRAAESTEKLICLLAGKIEIEPTKGKKRTFYTGDYFVMPKGFEGKWTSQGHGLVKYISVQKTK